MAKQDNRARPLEAAGAAQPASDSTTPALPVPADPTLLGVVLPLTVTRAAAKDVIQAWRECFSSLRGALMLKRKQTGEAKTDLSAGDMRQTASSAS